MRARKAERRQAAAARGSLTGPDRVLADIDPGIGLDIGKPLILVAIALMGLVLGLAGCGNESDNGGGEGTTPVTTPSTGTSTDRTNEGTTTDEREDTTTGEDDGDNSGSGGEDGY
jgi:hypothetical protein